MTPQELKEYINTNITTNGKGEISGEKLNEILNGIVDALDSSNRYLPITFYIGYGDGFSGTVEEFLDAWGLTSQDLIDLLKGKYQGVLYKNPLTGGGVQNRFFNILTIDSVFGGDGELSEFWLYFGNMTSDGMQYTIVRGNTGDDEVVVEEHYN